VSGTLELARAEWEDGYRRLEDQRSDPVAYRRLLAQVDVLLEELRRRVGATYTLEQLADAYSDAERWSGGGPGWPRTLSLVESAAFYLYQRGAKDYRP
jgi:hypothetical protein